MKYLIYFFCLFFSYSCKKIDNWLDVKSKNSDVILKSLDDYQSLLDNTTVMNTTPGMGIICADNIHLLENTVLTVGNPSERNAYIWKEDIYEGAIGTGTGDWTVPYRAIAYANIVMEGTDKVTKSSAEKDNIRGSALYYRGFHYYQLLQLYAPQYVKGASLSCVLPMRSRSDISDNGNLITVEACYEQVIKDLTASLEILPIVPARKTRPSRSAALAMLAKVYLTMQSYDKALQYAEEYLKDNNELIDFSSLNTAATLPFPTIDKGNKEIVFYAGPISYFFVSYGDLRVNDELFDSYKDNDTRKSAFFRMNVDGSKSFKGRYTGTVGLFSGLANNEILLIKAECLVRTGSWKEGRDLLNHLCSYRYKDFSAPLNETTDDVLFRVLEERRKELVFTGNCRWEDLRRLNKDSRFAKTLTRTLSGKQYILPPNDPKYTLPVIPQELIIKNK
ncbi:MULTISPECIES: RagB/SusD family nutrient uptake outer membrane protein [unclassified Sphingobacterium]|uniref:RagB/SusD family nutrient uptake outer membrane protein n=1 Tax=unclassified Sphingobacterium TaxID=2609468 RepID=UPI00143BDA10|nr:RagB/SusD family nutrient uptake outer membrane protein [Sphingobacterium sp. B16(2022)]NJI74246.1 RagB/SusD family nutrient uptake outer membrane protein [Sphingobacterium sp. B16(2022)]